MEDIKMTQIKFLEIKNTLNGISTWLDIAEEKISGLEDNNGNSPKWSTERKQTENNNNPPNTKNNALQKNPRTHWARRQLQVT